MRDRSTVWVLLGSLWKVSEFCAFDLASVRLPSATTRVQNVQSCKGLHDNKKHERTYISDQLGPTWHGLTSDCSALLRNMRLLLDTPYLHGTVKMSDSGSLCGIAKPNDGVTVTVDPQGSLHIVGGGIHGT